MNVHVLLFQAGEDSEGIHSLEIKEKTVVLMFEEKDDAERYCGLLEAQDFPSPTVEIVDRSEIEIFCKQSGYESRFVEKGFIPNNQEERLLISPPHTNLDVSGWDENLNYSSDDLENETETDISHLDNLKRSLEDLL